MENFLYICNQSSDQSKKGAYEHLLFMLSMTVTSGLVYRMRLTTHRAPNKGNQKGQEKDVDLSEDDTIESFSTVTISETTNNMSHKNEE